MLSWCQKWVLIHVCAMSSCTLAVQIIFLKYISRYVYNLRVASEINNYPGVKSISPTCDLWSIGVTFFVMSPAIWRITNFFIRMKKFAIHLAISSSHFITWKPNLVPGSYDDVLSFIWHRLKAGIIIIIIIVPGIRGEKVKNGLDGRSTKRVSWFLQKRFVVMIIRNSFNRFREPGADHHASQMLKTLYSFKILLFVSIKWL